MINELKGRTSLLLAGDANLEAANRPLSVVKRTFWRNGSGEGRSPGGRLKSPEQTGVSSATSESGKKRGKPPVRVSEESKERVKPTGRD